MFSVRMKIKTKLNMTPDEDNIWDFNFCKVSLIKKCNNNSSELLFCLSTTYSFYVTLHLQLFIEPTVLN